jgi:hypothetical protein
VLGPGSRTFEPYQLFVLGNMLAFTRTPQDWDGMRPAFPGEVPKLVVDYVLVLANLEVLPPHQPNQFAKYVSRTRSFIHSQGLAHAAPGGTKN